MTKWLHAGAVCAWIALVLGPTEAPGEPAPRGRGPEPPVVNLPEAEHGFGNVSIGQQLEHTFVVFNRGGSDLQLSIPPSSCGCVKATLEPSTVARGRTAALRVVFQPTDPGRAEQVVWLHTNDPLCPRMPITLRALVLRPAQARPEFVTLQTDYGSPQTRDVTVSLPPSASLTALHVEHPDFAVGKRRLLADEAGSLWRIPVTANPGIPIGSHKTQVRIVLSGASKKQLVIHVRAVVAGRISVAPPSAFFGFLTASARPLPTKSLRLSSTDHKPFRILSAKTPHPSAFVVTFAPQKPGTTQTIEVTPARKGAWRGAVQAELEIVTDHPSAKRLVVPLSAHFGRSPIPQP